MSKRGGFFVVVALVAVLVLSSVSSVFAQTGTGSQGQSQMPDQGTNPGNAMAPSQQWMTLNAGQQHFYAFRYTGDRSDITVRVSAQPQNAVEFAVWTPEQFRQWQGSQNFDPIGRGTSNANLNNELFWQGNFTFQGTYYVVVRNRSQARASYNIQIHGGGVSFANQGQANQGAQQNQQGQSNQASQQNQQGQGSQATEGAANQQGSAPSTLPVTGALLQAATQPTSTQTMTDTRTTTQTRATRQTGDANQAQGTNPGNAMSPSTQWVNASSGMRWFAFRYPGNQAQVSIRMQQRNNASCGFEVFTPESMTFWQTGGQQNQQGQTGTQGQANQQATWPQGRPTVNPIGRGTPNSEMGGDLFWTGNFQAAGNYYVLVTCNQEAAGTNAQGAGTTATQGTGTQGTSTTAQTGAAQAGAAGFYLQIFGSGISFMNGQAAPQQWNAQGQTAQGSTTQGQAGTQGQTAGQGTTGQQAGAPPPSTLPVTGGKIK